jgi:hypothetical protein
LSFFAGSTVRSGAGLACTSCRLSMSPSKLTNWL